MSIKLATFLRTTLPLGLADLEWKDSGRYSHILLPDHMVSFWPDSIWTPEFTDLATVSPSPHRHVDGLAVASAAAVLTTRANIAMSVVDTVRRHPSLLAQTAVTISHLSQGRFILGLGSGEKENTLPYGFDFDRPVSRFEESIQVIKLLWQASHPVDFDGKFYQLRHARLDTELYEGVPPPIWMGAWGPRMLRILGEHADGWFPAGVFAPEEYLAKFAVIRQAAENAGRDPAAITRAALFPCLIGSEDDIEQMLQAPLVKAYLLQVSADFLKRQGFDHPMGSDWGGFNDIEPDKLLRDDLLRFMAHVSPDMIRSVIPHGNPNQVARSIKAYVDAGVDLPCLLDYGGMAGLRFAANSQARVRETEDELLRLTSGAGS